MRPSATRIGFKSWNEDYTMASTFARAHAARAATIARARDTGILRPLWRRAEIALARDRAYLARLPMQR